MYKLCLGLSCLSQAAQVKFPIESLIEDGDMDGDGRISFPEFKKLLRTTSINSRMNAYSGPLNSGPLNSFSILALSGRSGEMKKGGS